MPRLFAAVYDPLMHGVETRWLSKWRAEVLSRARGRVIEIGAGTGVNLPLYPATVDEIVLTEPDPHMRKRLARKASELRVSARIVDASADALPFADGAFDTAVATLVLCTVPDAPAALAEIRRVLVPNGKFLFLEHIGGDEGSRRLVWQHRVEPVWRRLAGGCHLTRHTVDSITAAGFEITWLEREDFPGALKLGSPVVRGAATVHGNRPAA